MSYVAYRLPFQTCPRRCYLNPWRRHVIILLLNVDAGSFSNLAVVIKYEVLFKLVYGYHLVRLLSDMNFSLCLHVRMCVCVSERACTCARVNALPFPAAYLRLHLSTAFSSTQCRLEVLSQDAVQRLNGQTLCIFCFSFSLML